MAQYFVTSSVPANADWSILAGILRSNGLPVTDIQTSGDIIGQIIVVTDTDLTQSQQTLLNSLVSQFDPRPRESRSIYAIYTDLVALTAGQKTTVWNDFNSGTPPKYLLDEGPNAAALAVLDWTIKKLGASPAATTDAQLRAVSMYVQDNPKYLKNPTFDTSINILGDQPIG